MLKAKPDNRQALFALALTDEAKAESMPDDRPAAIALFLKSAAAARKLRDAHKDLSPGEAELIARLLYKEACAFALQGKGDAAMTALADAFDAGFDDKEMFANDEDLNSLRKAAPTSSNS